MSGVTASAHTSKEIFSRLDAITSGTLTRTPKSNSTLSPMVDRMGLKKARVLSSIYVTITVGIEAERAFHTSVNRWNPIDS